MTEDAAKQNAENRATDDGNDIRHPPSDSPNKKNTPQKDAKTEISAEEYVALKKRVEELESLREKFLHAAADFENAKKRNERDKEEFIRFSQERILRGLLPALDNFERAIGHESSFNPANADPEALRQHFKGLISGVQMVQKQILDLLKTFGLERLKTVGEKFDPHLHEVVAHVAETGEEDRIVDELEPGYKLHDRLLRAAKVRVRVSPAPKDGSAEKQDEIT